MHQAFLIIAIVLVCLWTYLFLARGFFWRVAVDQSLPAATEARVVAVVPARNEAGVVEKCVASLLRQSGLDVQVVLVDDASTDATAESARAAAATVGCPERLTVITSVPLAEGWTGKLWAVRQGVERALATSPDFLLFTDADVEHGPETVATLISIAERGGYDMASYMVKLHCESEAEKLLIPAFVYFFFQLYPPAWIADAKAKTAGAAGGCMLVRPAALARAGGIEAIRSEIIDDCALARAIKSSGGRVWLGLTESSRSLRSYGSFAEIGRTIARTAFNQLRHSALLLAGTVIGLVLTYLLPAALLGSGDRPAMTLGAAAWALMAVSYLPMVRFYRLNPVWALTLPLAAIFYMFATLWSAVQYWSGRGGQWKGRAQDAALARTGPSGLRNQR
jgi:hopene-associated glycosyltransferase HpnB